MAYTGYHFYLDHLEFPYAPSELKITVDSNNKTVELINGDAINILKNPKLTEIEFEIELPRGRQYAFANKLVSSKTYTDHFKELMLTKKPAQLVITRNNPFLSYSTGIGGTKNDFESTSLTVSLEGYELEENADNAYDIKVSLKFKEYVTYGTVKQVVLNKPTTNNTQTTTPTKQPVTTTTKPNVETKKHKVVNGDTLMGISRKYYGNSNKWKTIYDANKKVIEDTAKKYGRASSSNGHWIYPGTELIIPADSK